MTTAGIDFGTTNSVVSIWTSDGPEVLPMDEPPGDWAQLGFDKVVPTVISIDDDSTTEFGWAAKTGALPALEAVKRLMRADEFVTVGEHQIVIEEAVTLFFAHLKRQAAKQGVDVDRVVVTVPANSRGVARYRTRLCAAMAGLEVLNLINEPTAAAMAASARMIHDGKVLVVDLGGGTLDVTLLESISGVFIEHSSSGVPALGGRDFDTRFAASIMETVPSAGWTPAQKKAFQLSIERAKILLSDQEFTNVDLPDGSSRRVTRSMYDEATRSLVEKLQAPIEECLQAARVETSDVDHLLLVGGSCRVPAVRKFVVDMVGRTPSADVNPMTAIAEGAAVAAAILTNELEDNDFFVSTEHALGTIATHSNGESYFSPIIERNQKLPAVQEEVYSPASERQESVNVQVIEGRAEQLDHPDNVVLKQWSVELPSAERSDDRSFTLRYQYDLDGLLNVRATDDLSGDILLEDDVSFGFSRDKRELVRMAKNVESAVESGRIEPTLSQSAGDPEAIELLQRARSKVIPFLEDDEADELRALASRLEGASNEGEVTECKEALKKALSRYSYLL